MNATTDRIVQTVLLSLLTAASLCLVAALPTVLVFGITGTDAVGVGVVTLVMGLGSVTGLVGLAAIVYLIRYGWWR